MTPEERFERIETNLQKASELQIVLLESQQRLTESVSSLTASVAAHVEESQTRTQETHKLLDTLIEESGVRAQESHKLLNDLMRSVDAYVQDSRARTKRLEENLDALIRAITTEHKNGKKKG